MAKTQRRNPSFLIQHLKSNNGDGYIWFISMTVVFLLMFGALFTIMQTAANTRDIRNSVDEAARDVFTEIREIAYDKITDGATDYTNTADVLSKMSDYYVMELMANHLDANFRGNGLTPFIEQYDAGGRVEYEIANFSFEYIDQITSYNDGEKRGDVDKDGEVNDQDLTLLQEYIDGVAPEWIMLVDVDLNRDNSVNKKDVMMLEGLIKYFATHPKDSLESSADRSSAFLMITFTVNIPVDFGTINLDAVSEACAYYSTMSFKPPM